MVNNAVALHTHSHLSTYTQLYYNIIIESRILAMAMAATTTTTATKMAGCIAFVCALDKNISADEQHSRTLTIQNARKVATRNLFHHCSCVSGLACFNTKKKKKNRNIVKNIAKFTNSWSTI